jgi:signal recognition particle subunit SEC65
MTKPEEQNEAKEPRPSRLEEARRVIEEYVNDLREIIKKLRRRLN